MSSFSTPARAVAAAAAFAAVLSACSNTDGGTSSTPGRTEAPSSVTPSTATTPSASATPEEEHTDLGPLLTVTIDGQEVLPNADEIDLSTGEKVLITVDSDRAGELHVHSTPEQFIEFDAGTTQAKLVLQTPGSVEVEDHDTGAVVALIEVR